MSPGLLLLLYCAAIAGASLLGGLLPQSIRMTHTRTQLAMSMVSGLMLGVAVFHLLPHSIALQDRPDAVDVSVQWLMVGLIVMLLLLRLFHFHQHDFSMEEAALGEDPAPPACDHGHGHGHHDHGAHRLSWVGIALGLGLHTLIDGVALGAALQGHGLGGHGGLLGAGVFLAILLHKPLDAMSITAVMGSGGWSAAHTRLVNLVFALLCPLGAIVFYFGVGGLPGGGALVAAALAFSAGAFVCIALGDLLPEVHFHSHDRVLLTTVFLIGIFGAYMIGKVEPAGVHPDAVEEVIEQVTDHP